VGLGQLPHQAGELEGAGDPEDVDVVVGHAVAEERVLGPLEELVGDEAVEPRHAEREAALGRREVAFVDAGHGRLAPYTLRRRAGTRRAAMVWVVGAGEESGTCSTTSSA